MALSPSAPAWAADLVLAYESGAHGQFILHGNVSDRLPVEERLVTLHRWLEEERTKAAGRARVARDSLDMTEVNVKEAELEALSEQALADFAAREGITLEPTVATAPPERAMGGARATETEGGKEN